MLKKYPFLTDLATWLTVVGGVIIFFSLFPLPVNSAVFYGKEPELQGTLAELRKLEAPSNVSVIGERRIGKSSLLNQIYQALAAESQVISIHTTTQNWSVASQADFFTYLLKLRKK
jgi:ribosome biogenesis GTPase A